MFHRFIVLYFDDWFELSGKIPSVGEVGVELDILFSNFKQITEITITINQCRKVKTLKTRNTRSDVRQ